MYRRHTQKLILILIFAGVCHAQSPIGGLLVPIKNTSGSTIFRGQTVIGDSTSASLINPYSSNISKITSLSQGSAISCTLQTSRAYSSTSGLDSVKCADSVSVATWFYAYNYIYPYQGLVVMNSPGLYEGYWLTLNINTLYFYLGDGGGWYYCGGAAVPSLGHWHLVVGTFNSVNAFRTKLYLDGVITDSLTTPNSILFNTYDFVMLGQYYSGTYNFWGKIDEPQIYHATLTAAEVSALWNGGNGVYGTGLERGLKVGWHLDENTGTAISSYGPTSIPLTFDNGATNWRPGIISQPLVSGNVVYPVGTVYNDSIKNDSLGFMTVAGPGYVALQSPRTATAIPGDRILVTGDTVGEADCQVTTGTTNYGRQIGHPLTKPFFKNVRGDSVLIADIHKN